MNPVHLDYDTLADLAEGMLDNEHAASAHEHLELCPACRALSADLSDVSRILAEAPLPPLPRELAERIDAAISAETMGAASVASLAGHRNRRRLRLLSVAAASVVVLGGGAVVGGSLLNDSSLDSGTPTLHSDRPAPDRSARGAPERPSSLAPGRARYIESGTDYRDATLDRQLRSILSGSPGAAPRLGSESTVRGMSLAKCVEAVTQGHPPAVVDRARHEGRQATIVAVPAGTDAWDVWIVGPNCSADDLDLIKKTRVTG